MYALCFFHGVPGNLFLEVVEGRDTVMDDLQSKKLNCIFFLLFWFVYKMICYFLQPLEMRAITKKMQYCSHELLVAHHHHPWLAVVRDH